MTEKSKTSEADSAVTSPTQNKRNVVVGVLGCIVLVICVAVCAAIAIPAIAGLGAVNKIANDIEKTNQIDQEKLSKPSAMNQVVNVGQIEWNVTKVIDYGSRLPSSRKFIEDISNPEVRYIRVELTVTNRRTTQETILNVKLVDNQGRSFAASGNSYINRPEGESGAILANLNPDISKNLVEVFEVPLDAKGLKFEATDLKLFGTEKAYIDLGL